MINDAKNYPKYLYFFNCKLAPQINSGLLNILSTYQSSFTQYYFVQYGFFHWRLLPAQPIAGGVALPIG